MRTALHGLNALLSRSESPLFGLAVLKTMFFVVFPEDNAEDSGSDTENVGGGVDSSSEDDCLSDEGEVDVDDPSTWRIINKQGCESSVLAERQVL